MWVLSGTDGSRCTVFVENELKFSRGTVYVIEEIECKILEVIELRKLILISVEIYILYTRMI